MATPTTHVKARQPHPMYPARTPVPDGKVLWSVKWASYEPTQFTHPDVVKFDCSKRKGGWADPVIAPDGKELSSRLSYCGPIRLDPKTQHPMNPVGRTGMIGRGLLGKWGPNHAADPVVTRCQAKTGLLEMVVIKRQDTGEWAIPGGMVDAGESVSMTLRREFSEEALRDSTMSKELDQLFKSGDELYKGYVDDPRNTDDAWMETVAMHFHCDDQLGRAMELEAADDAVAVKWLQIEENEEDMSRLYASHKELVLTAINRFRSQHATSRSSARKPTSNQAGQKEEEEEAKKRRNSRRPSFLMWMCGGRWGGGKTTTASSSSSPKNRSSLSVRSPTHPDGESWQT